MLHLTFHLLPGRQPFPFPFSRREWWRLLSLSLAHEEEEEEEEEDDEEPALVPLLAAAAVFLCTGKSSGLEGAASSSTGATWRSSRYGPSGTEGGT